jgi:hypothetical protein
MKCACYRIDPPTLVSALTERDFLARYLDDIGAELPGLADRGMVIHLRRMSTLASRVQVDGLEVLASEDAGAADALLTDLVAVATYRGWTLPMVQLGVRDLAVETLPRGLLGADAGTDGAHLWLIDPETIALARTRESDELSEIGEHPRS